ncbi:hypothetical protein V1525DRAFT_266334 [Lipomyces kononenkoae]|uniref:Uncharacterized protein n=1 Tax=Lipomyces kononenkoae TaxID=34357 RepID=A0ACC3T802_LIPKO
MAGRYNLSLQHLNKVLIGITELNRGRIYLFSNDSMTSASPSNMQLENVLTPSLFAEIHDFWFQHVKGTDSITLPREDEYRRWFSRNEELDNACVQKFRPVLDSIKLSNVTATEIIAVVKESSPLNWLDLVILLDQLSRNCYRDSESAVVFNYFDLLAGGVALHAIQKCREGYRRHQGR